MINSPGIVGCESDQATVLDPYMLSRMTTSTCEYR